MVGFPPGNFGPFTLFLVKSRRVAPVNFGAYVRPASVKFSNLAQPQPQPKKSALAINTLKTASTTTNFWLVENHIRGIWRRGGTNHAG